MEIKILAKNTAILASPKILKFFVGILKSKLMAIFLGTTGVGLTSQLMNTIDMIRQSTLSFLPDGMVKLIAKQNSMSDDAEKISEIIKTYFVMVLPIAFFVTILGYIFSDELTKYVFGDIKYKLFFLIGFTAIPVSIMGASFRSFLKAYKEIKSFATAEFLIIIINLVLFVPLIYYYKLIGGVIYVTLTFSVSFGVIFYLVRKNVFIKHGISFRSIQKAVFSQVYFKELMSFITVGIVSGTFRVFVNISTRSIVVNDLGIEQIGIYAPISRWEGLFLGFILPSVYTYLYPRLSEAKDDIDICNVLNDVVRLITFITLPFILIAIATRVWIIPLFYSVDFMDATIYLPIHFLFLLFAVWSTIFEQVFAPTGRLKFFLIFSILINAVSLGLVYYYVPLLGMYGYILKFTVIPFFTFLFYIIFWSSTINFKLKIENIQVVVYAILSTIAIFYLKDSNVYLQLSIAIILVSMQVLFLKKAERNFLIKKIKF